MSPLRPSTRGRTDGRRDAAGRQEREANDQRVEVRHDGPVLVTLVGDEPLAPLVLARHVDASRVVCLALPVVEWRVEPLLARLRRDGRRPESFLPTIQDVPAGIDELDRLVALDAGQHVVFDLTNARGILGFSLYELARRYEVSAPDRCRVVRVDWSARTIRSVSPDGLDVEPLRVAIGLADYLGVHGKELLGLERGPGSRSPFGRAAYRLASAIPQARPILDATHRGGLDRPLRLQGKRSLPLVEELVEDGVLEWRGSTLFATSMRAFQFLHGRWLEEYLFEIADASGQFDDCASGVRFRWAFEGEERDAGRGDVDNEIDFAGTAHGRATIASCKTGGHDVNGPLYELLTLAERAAGRSVISVFATTDVLDRSARRRAAALGVRTLDATRLPDPELVLQSLMHGAPTPAREPARETRTRDRSQEDNRRRPGGRHRRR
jgi:hypothetical protein